MSPNSSSARKLAIADQLDEARDMMRANRLDEAAWRLDAIREAFAAESGNHGDTTTDGPPDAALLALAEQTAEASRIREAARDRLEQIEIASRRPEPPTAVMRTAQDAAMSLFVGSPLGSPYTPEEIAAIRVFARAWGKIETDGRVLAAYSRATDILDAWANWQEALAAHEASTGLDAANRAYDAAVATFDRLAERLVQTPATTIGAALEKVRALRGHYTDDETMAERIARDVRRYSVDEDVVALTALRDLARLAGEGSR